MRHFKPLNRLKRLAGLVVPVVTTIIALSFILFVNGCDFVHSTASRNLNVTPETHTLKQVAVDATKGLHSTKSALDVTHTEGDASLDRVRDEAGGKPAVAQSDLAVLKTDTAQAFEIPKGAEGGAQTAAVSALENIRDDAQVGLLVADHALQKLLHFFANRTSGKSSLSESLLCSRDGALTSLGAIVAWAERLKARSELLQFVRRTSPRIFVAGLLKNNCELSLHYSVELLKLSFIYGQSNFQNIFISLYEGGSDAHDCTAQVLLFLKEVLAALEVPHSIRVDQESRPPDRARIDFLQEIRNEALAELYSSRREYDEVVYLSDTFFCASDIIRLLRHSEASIKCGMDFSVGGHGAQFYDTWVAHDMTGNMFSNNVPFVQDENSQNALIEQRAFQVSSCWNGITILRAAVFYSGARFRRSIDSTECHAAETELICRDFRALGHGNIVVDPQVTVTYSREEYIKLRAGLGGQITLGQTALETASPQNIPTISSWQPLPTCDSCAPLDGNPGHDPDRTKIYKFDWHAHYQKHGVPLSHDASTTIHDCTSTFAVSCNLTRGVRLRFIPWERSNSSCMRR